MNKNRYLRTNKHEKPKKNNNLKANPSTAVSAFRKEYGGGGWHNSYQQLSNTSLPFSSFSSETDGKRLKLRNFCPFLSADKGQDLEMMPTVIEEQH